MIGLKPTPGNPVLANTGKNGPAVSADIKAEDIDGGTTIVTLGGQITDNPNAISLTNPADILTDLPATPMEPVMQADIPDSTSPVIQGDDPLGMFTDKLQQNPALPVQSLAATITVGQQSGTQKVLASTMVPPIEQKMAKNVTTGLQPQGQTQPLSDQAEPAKTTGKVNATVTLPADQMTDHSRPSANLAAQISPKGPVAETTARELLGGKGPAGVTIPTTGPSDKGPQLAHNPNVGGAHGPQSTTFDAVATSPVQDFTKQAALAQSQPAGLPLQQKTGPERDSSLTVLQQTVASKSTSTLPSLIQNEPLTQDKQTVVRPSAATEILTTASLLTGTGKPVSGVFTPEIGNTTPLDLTTPEQRSASASVLATSDLNAESVKTSSMPEASTKTPAKPFTEALMAQVKSVDVTQGRTTVNLIPRGLGNIEIEVLSESDVASKIVVRVENPAVLQALRDDRQILAQAIGASDSDIFDFQEHSAGEQFNHEQNNSGQNGTGMTDAMVLQPQQQHLDVVQDGQLDILT